MKQVLTNGLLLAVACLAGSALACGDAEKPQSEARGQQVITQGSIGLLAMNDDADKLKQQKATPPSQQKAQETTQQNAEQAAQNAQSAGKQKAKEPVKKEQDERKN